jgi:CelD/BcsL family acetyltransferase involved in cellulose biosynthesis
VTRVDFAPNDSIAGEFLVPDDRPDVAAHFMESLGSRPGFDVVCLNGFELDSPVLREVERSAQGRRFGIESEAHAYALVDLTGGYDAYWRAIPGDTRRKLSHRARKIESLGASVTGAVPDPDATDTDERVARMIAITEASYKLGGQRLADQHRHFLSEIAHRFAARGMLSLPILTIGGRDAAFVLGVVERGCFYDVTLSYDESFARLGPGMYLMQHVLRQFAATGIQRVVSHGAHEYKRTWSTAFVPQRRLFFFPPAPRATASRLVRFTLQPLWRRLGAAA